MSNFAQIDPPVDAIHAEIANPLNPDPVTVINNATIHGTRTGIFAGTDGLGSVTVNNGNIIGGTTVTGDANGIYAVSTNFGNKGDVTVNVNGNVIGSGAPLGTATAPLYSSLVFPFINPFRAGVPGLLAAYPDVTGFGVYAQTFGSGNVIVHADGTGTITANTAGAQVGIHALSSNMGAGAGGNVLVTLNENIVSSGNGIEAQSDGNTAGGGNVQVSTTVASTITTTANGVAVGNGISAQITNAGSSGSITVNALGNITAAATGIFARTSGTGQCECHSRQCHRQRRERGHGCDRCKDHWRRRGHGHHGRHRHGDHDRRRHDRHPCADRHRQRVDRQRPATSPAPFGLWPSPAAAASSPSRPAARARPLPARQAMPSGWSTRARPA